MYQFVRCLRQDLPYSECILFQEYQMEHIVGTIYETNSNHSYLNRYSVYVLDKYKLNKAENDKAYILYNLNNQIYLKGYLIGYLEQDGWFQEYNLMKEYNPRLFEIETVKNRGYNNKESELKDMLFNYENLEACAGTGQGLGSWKGTSVFSISKRNISKTDSKNAYIIYDMGNKLYKNGYILGTVDIRGDVDLYDEPVNYNSMWGQEKQTYTYEKPKLHKDNEPMVDIDIETLDEAVILKEVNEAVDALLAEACKW